MSVKGGIVLSGEPAGGERKKERMLEGEIIKVHFKAKCTFR
jgi:hypothetical protein